MSICKELKIYQPITFDVSSMLQQREKFNVVQFLVSLKPEYESVRSQILASPQLPSFLDVFSRLQQATLSGQGSQLSFDQSNEISALVASYVALGGRGGQGGRGAHGGHDARGNCTRGRESRKCTHCGQTNHSVDYCWDLHGRPSGPTNQAICQDATSLSTSSNLTPEIISISNDEHDQFLSRIQAASSSIATLAYSGSQYREEDWYGA
ncbi:hypothetical protein F2P56_028194 [Juglans regia]|uniref:Uncharacterized protein LOC108983749 isoform X3 n=2 Tax=Juglans regia TaxID=51240 RepID=A0A2I4DV75_JUGRE|nr:uncharacterized protein LOC108983749 isoform X3 [Juglans regia]KAF5453280.1 hypothetical protein F2P56_028194 [Juglans regia]